MSDTERLFKTSMPDQEGAVDNPILLSLSFDEELKGADLHRYLGFMIGHAVLNSMRSALTKEQQEEMAFECERRVEWMKDLKNWNTCKEYADAFNILEQMVRYWKSGGKETV